MLSFFPGDVLDEILNLIESVSEGFLPTLDVYMDCSLAILPTFQQCFSHIRTMGEL